MKKVYDSLDEVITQFKQKKPHFGELKNKVKTDLEKRLSKTEIKISNKRFIDSPAEKKPELYD